MAKTQKTEGATVQTPAPVIESVNPDKLKISELESELEAIKLRLAKRESDLNVVNVAKRMRDARALRGQIESRYGIRFVTEGASKRDKGATSLVRSSADVSEVPEAVRKAYHFAGDVITNGAKAIKLSADWSEKASLPSEES